MYVCKHATCDVNWDVIRCEVMKYDASTNVIRCDVMKYNASTCDEICYTVLHVRLYVRMYACDVIMYVRIVMWCTEQWRSVMSCDVTHVRMYVCIYGIVWVCEHACNVGMYCISVINVLWCEVTMCTIMYVYILYAYKYVCVMYVRMCNWTWSNALYCNVMWSVCMDVCMHSMYVCDDMQLN